VVRGLLGSPLGDQLGSTKLGDVEYGTAVMPQGPNDLVAFCVLCESMLDGSYWEEPAPPGT
jgi:hypothetical protein